MQDWNKTLIWKINILLHTPCLQLQINSIWCSIQNLEDHFKLHLLSHTPCFFLSIYIILIPNVFQILYFSSVPVAYIIRFPWSQGSVIKYSRALAMPLPFRNHASYSGNSAIYRFNFTLSFPYIQTFYNGARDIV